MKGVPMNLHSGPIKICQFGKWTDKPIFNEDSSTPQEINLGSRHKEKSSAQWLWNEKNRVQDIETQTFQETKQECR